MLHTKYSNGLVEKNQMRKLTKELNTYTTHNKLKIKLLTYNHGNLMNYHHHSLIASKIGYRTA